MISPYGTEADKTTRNELASCEMLVNRLIVRDSSTSNRTGSSNGSFKGYEMAHPDNKGTLPSGAVINFLAKTLPFSELNAMGRKRIAESCLVKFFPKGTVIFEQDVTQVTHLYLIQKGAVKIYRINEDESITPMDYCGEGATFGTFAIMGGVGNNVTVEATEDTVCMLLDKTTLLKILQEKPYYCTRLFWRLLQGSSCKGLFGTTP